MAPLSWNEIKKRAIEFSKSWEGVQREKAEAQTFWNEFFTVFGQTRRKVAVLEQEVQKLDSSKGYIDLFWPKILLAEAKSSGKDLVKAKEQAISYLHGIKDEELPQYILTSDFENISLLDLETSESWQFKVSKLHEHIKLFSFVAGYTKTDFKTEDPVNIKAAELMGNLHDSLFEAGFTGHDLELFLVRVLFCLFADDTGIFDRGIFFDLIRHKTREDGSDVGPILAMLFEVLNTEENGRMRNLDEDLQAFPFVGGRLFEERIQMSSFDSRMRHSLIQCCLFNWSNISPAVFGSLFQSVMDKEVRRNLGAHYTSEESILKLIRPLFLDGLREEFEKVKRNSNRLREFHHKLSKLKFLDPACGCGNFLVVTYRELRLLELEILKLQLKERMGLDAEDWSLINVDQMYGIEIEEFPSKIAEVAMWLVDHQMNMKLSEEIGQYYTRLPLVKSANIVNANALSINWNDVINNSELSYILGNPPFVGAKLLDKLQKEMFLTVTNGIPHNGLLDLVCAWYVLAGKYIQNTNIKVAFVSTNSITQGEQVAILWKYLMNTYHLKIHFAHRTFQWNNEARGKAAVHVVIIGFGNFDIQEKIIYDYEHVKSYPSKIVVNNINPYLINGDDFVISSRSNPISNVLSMHFGNMPLDGGHLLLSNEDRDNIVSLNEGATKYIKRFISAYDFLNNKLKWCLWLVDSDPSEIKSLTEIMRRIELVRVFRQNSKAESTRKFALTPSLFRDRNNPAHAIIIPRVSSENRIYIPLGLADSNSIIGDTCMYIATSDLYYFGMLSSIMHMSWVRQVAGRLESRYRYSKDVVYNNFPWPEVVTDKDRILIEQKSLNILSIRNSFVTSSLSDLYNPLTMPSSLLKAHRDLDQAIDKLYRSKPFSTERERIEYLFSLHQKHS